jgi:hypothetical protein
MTTEPMPEKVKTGDDRTSSRVAGSSDSGATGRLVRIAVKTLILFIAANALWFVLQPLPALESISLYNTFVAGRVRLPYGLNAGDYNLSPTRLGTMFATHEIARPKAADEFRVVVLGDSSVWGILLKPHETLTEQLNALNLIADDGRKMHFYNLAYPMNSVVKDVYIRQKALAYQPDLIVWLVTMESLALDNQFEPPLLLANGETVPSIMADNGLDWDFSSMPFAKTTQWDQTLVGQRQQIADWLRLQAYGIVWSSTGIDQIYKDYTPRSNDYETEVAWHGDLPDDVEPPDFRFDVLTTPLSVPLILVNEPMYIGNGANSDLHYNAWSPRWAYDRYRNEFDQLAASNQWLYWDAWDIIPPSEFTDSPVHLTPAGSTMFAQWLSETMQAQHIVQQ